MKILIQNGRLWDGNAFHNADLLTHGKTIAKIGPHLTDQADFVFDATGKTVMPGLVDLHVHFKGISSDRYGIGAEMSSLPFGVTAANDAGGTHGDWQLMDSFGVKNTIFVGVDIKDNRPELELAAKRMEKFGDKVVGLKVYFDTTVSRVWNITPLQEICAFARQRGLNVMVHCAHSPTPMVDIVNTLSAGDILTHLYHGKENPCTANNFEVFSLAAARGVVLDSGFAGTVHTDLGHMRAAFEAGFLPHTISTDITCCSAYMRGGRYGMTLCMSLARKMGMEEEALFKAVTSTPAKVLGKEREWGALEVGRCADVAVLDYTDEGFDLTDEAGNRAQSDRGYRCVLTVADGQVVYRH